MNRRTFIRNSSVASIAATAVTGGAFWNGLARAEAERKTVGDGREELRADLVIIGGGLGGCAAALAALRNGLRVVMTEETDWIGGQLTQQGVPPDEHRWIESFGCTRAFRELRAGIREYYRRHYPLTESARSRWNLNPGDGSVSRLCHEPKVALAALESLLAPYLSGRKLVLLLGNTATRAEVGGDRVGAVVCRSLLTGTEIRLAAPMFIDATETGELLPLCGAEFVTGAESKKQTGELHAPDEPAPQNQQAFTVCFALDHVAGENHVIAKPAEYAFWKDYVPKLTPPWPGKLLDFKYTYPTNLQPRVLGLNPEGPAPGAVTNLWTYRRIANRANFQPGAYPGDISLVNWPQNDYLLGNLIGVPEAEKRDHVRRAKQLNLSLLYWLQTEAPTPDGKQGFPGLRLRGDVMGSEDGMAKYPYIRESRRIKAAFTVLEQHVGATARAQLTGKKEAEVTAESFADSVGVGSYNIDLHPTSGGTNYIDVPSLPFQIPLGALLPERLANLLPASKNIGTTHITNGCYRLHPVEWNIGEAAGALAAFALRKNTRPHAVRESKTLLAEFQDLLRGQGVETHWPKGQF